VSNSQTAIPSAGGFALPGERPNLATALLQFLRRAFSFPVVLGALLVGAVFLPARLFAIDPDSWWHVKVGETILATHHWPTVDPYSFTVTGQPWMAYEWLGEVLWAGVMQMGGVRGLEILLIVLGSTVMIALYAYATLCSGNSKAAFVACALLFVLANVSFTLRPQMLGYLFLILTLIALELFRQGRRTALWLLPLLFAVWVNTHGSFIVGLGAIFVSWICGMREFRLGEIEAHAWTSRERKQISLVFLFCLAVLPITPYSSRLAVYPFDMMFSQPLNVVSIQEWRAMPFELLAGRIFLVMLLALIVCQVALRVRWRLEELVLCLAGTAMACLHVRFLLIFVPFFIPVLTRILSRYVPAYDRAKDQLLLNAVILAAIAWGLVHYLPSQAELQQRVAESSPVKAVEYMQAHRVPGPTYNNYAYGGYLVWSLGSNAGDFIDGRGDLFERGGVLGDYMQISLLRPGALAVLNGYGVRSCLLQRTEPLATVLSALPEWQRAFSDSHAVLFVRKDSLDAAASAIK
jgi:hypothetical protein